MSKPLRHVGAVVIVILVMFTIATAILGIWAKTIMMQHRQTRIRNHAIQARWLAESGLRRAVARRGAEPDYSGETWLILPDVLSGRDGGRVEIVVEPMPDAPDSLRITARADYPDAPIRRVRHTESIDIVK